MTETTIYVVEDDAGLRKSLVRVLQANGLKVETYESSEDFLARHRPDVSGCLVLDVHLPGIDGLELQQRLNQGGSAMPIVFLTGEGDIPASVQAIKAGAVDFLTKPVPVRDLIAAIEHALEQGSSQADSRAELVRLEQRLASLTPREREVLEALATGRLNKQIAADLGIVEQTIKFHRRHIMERMQAQSAAELMYMAARLGLGPKPGSGSGH